MYSLSEKETAIYKRNHKLKRTCTIVLVVLLGITFVGHQFATSIWGPYSIMNGTTFEDYDSFVKFMEQNILPEQQNNSSDDSASEIVGDTIYYDEYGNEISEEEALTRRLEDLSGNVVCEYIDCNKSVISIRYTPKDGTILPITVCTQDDLSKAKQTAAIRHVIFGTFYIIEWLAIVLIYFLKKAK